MSSEHNQIHSVAGVSGVIISAREIYDAVVRLTGQIDVLIQQQSQSQGEIIDHEARLRSIELGNTNSQRDIDSRVKQLESSRWPIPAASLLVSLAAIAILIIEKLTS